MQFKYIQDSAAIVSLTSADVRTIRKALEKMHYCCFDSELETIAWQLAADHKIETSLLVSEFNLKWDERP